MYSCPEKDCNWTWEGLMNKFQDVLDHERKHRLEKVVKDDKV